MNVEIRHDGETWGVWFSGRQLATAASREEAVKRMHDLRRDHWRAWVRANFTLVQSAVIRADGLNPRDIAQLAPAIGWRIVAGLPVDAAAAYDARDALRAHTGHWPAEALHDAISEAFPENPACSVARYIREHGEMSTLE